MFRCVSWQIDTGLTTPWYCDPCTVLPRLAVQLYLQLSANQQPAGRCPDDVDTGSMFSAKRLKRISQRRYAPFNLQNTSGLGGQARQDTTPRCVDIHSRAVARVSVVDSTPRA